jgi:uncharacterized protein YecT (DUF1311 family)
MHLSESAQLRLNALCKANAITITFTYDDDDHPFPSFDWQVTKAGNHVLRVDYRHDTDPVKSTLAIGHRPDVAELSFRQDATELNEAYADDVSAELGAKIEFPTILDLVKAQLFRVKLGIDDQLQAVVPIKPQATGLRDFFIACPLSAQLMSDAHASGPASPPGSTRAASAFSSEGLAGIWSVIGGTVTENATIEITEVASTSFVFKLSAISGTHDGEIAGTALIQGSTAAFRDPESKCALTFERRDQRISVGANDECSQMGGVGVAFAGDYQYGRLKPALPTLRELGVLADGVGDDAVATLVGSSYEQLLSGFQLMSDGQDSDSLGTKVVAGTVRGLVGITGGIVMSRADGRLYIAVIDGDTVRYFTNDPMRTKQLPQTIEQWTRELTDKTIVFASNQGVSEPATPELEPRTAAGATAKPSFDCAKASSSIERTICGDPRLGVADSTMAAVYAEVANGLGTDQKSALKAEQLNWLKNVRNACTSGDCLASAYRARIDQLAAQRH